MKKSLALVLVLAACQSPSVQSPNAALGSEESARMQPQGTA